MSFDADADMEQGADALNAAADHDKLTAILDGDKVAATQGEYLPVKEWMSNLPRNITVGVMDAASSTVDAITSFGKAAAKSWTQPSPTMRAINEANGLTSDGQTQEDVREDWLAHPMVEQTYGPVRVAYQNLRNELALGSSTSDEVTQSLAQFGIPFLGWSKLLGVQKAFSVAGVTAESLTASTALPPRATRMADFLAQGRTVQGKFCDALNTLAPDGSALNAYIDYMTDRGGESEAEGRFKNVIDSLTTTAATAALFKIGAKALKTGLNMPARGAKPAEAAPAR